jgi:hypothetical protein
MVGLQTLDLPIGVRVPASQPTAPYACFTTAFSASVSIEEVAILLR